MKNTRRLLVLVVSLLFTTISVLKAQTNDQKSNASTPVISIGTKSSGIVSKNILLNDGALAVNGKTDATPYVASFTMRIENGKDISKFFNEKNCYLTDAMRSAILKATPGSKIYMEKIKIALNKAAEPTLQPVPPLAFTLAAE